MVTTAIHNKPLVSHVKSNAAAWLRHLIMSLVVIAILATMLHPVVSALSPVGTSLPHTLTASHSSLAGNFTPTSDRQLAEKQSAARRGWLR